MDYQSFKAGNPIEEDSNPISNFIDSIMMDDTTADPDMQEGITALSRDSQNLYYQLIKDVGRSLGISETFNDPISIQIDKLDGDTQEKLNLFSAFYKLGEGCNSGVKRIERREFDTEPPAEYKETKDPNELCPGVKDYKLGLDVSRWPSGALAGEVITKVKKVAMREVSFYERLTLIQRHFPKPELCEIFSDAQYRLRRLFEDYLYPPTYTPEHDKLLDIEKKERQDFPQFQYKYMALFALQEIANQLRDLLKKSRKTPADISITELCQIMQANAAEYTSLFGSINRDLVARAVCLGDTYAILCAAPRIWDTQEIELNGVKKSVLKASVVPKKWWHICTKVYDDQDVEDKMRYATVALFFAYMPNRDNYRIHRMPDSRFNKTIATLAAKKETEAETEAQQQQSEKLSKLQVAMKNDIILTLIDIDKYAAAAYEKFRSKYPENMLEHIEVKFNDYKVFINSIIVRYNRAESGDYPVKYKYVQNLVNYVKQVGSLKKLHMKEPIDMKVIRRQSGGRRSKQQIKPRRVFSLKRSYC